MIGGVGECVMIQDEEDEVPGLCHQSCPPLPLPSACSSSSYRSVVCSGWTDRQPGDQARTKITVSDPYQANQGTADGLDASVRSTPSPSGPSGPSGLGGAARVICLIFTPSSAAGYLSLTTTGGPLLPPHHHPQPHHHHHHPQTSSSNDDYDYHSFSYHQPSDQGLTTTTTTTSHASSSTTLTVVTSTFVPFSTHSFSGSSSSLLSCNVLLLLVFLSSLQPSLIGLQSNSSSSHFFNLTSSLSSKPLSTLACGHLSSLPPSPRRLALCPPWPIYIPPSVTTISSSPAVSVPERNMMVPRSFLYTAAPPPLQEKDPRSGARSKAHPKTTKNLKPKSSSKVNNNTSTSTSDAKANTKSSTASRTTASAPATPATETPVSRRPVTPTGPLEIPNRRSNRKEPLPLHRTRLTAQGQSRSSPDVKIRDDSLPGSVEALLSDTMIAPRRKRPAGRASQRLPAANYVEDFSRLMMEDVGTNKDRLASSGSLGQNSSLDILLSPPDSFNRIDQVFPSNDREGDFDLGMSDRSLSSDSVPSLEYDNESTLSFEGNSSPSYFSRKSTPEKKVRIPSTSQDCASDHPLLHRPHSPTASDVDFQETTIPLPATSSRSQRKLSVFKSNLTASIRAVRSAAQTTFSNFNASSTRRELMLNQTIFSFSPELTDERRPPPTDNPPSPALRRYLNPASLTISPAEMHDYHELPHSLSQKTTSKEKSKSPAYIQLQTYYRDPKKPGTAGASAPPIFSKAGRETQNTEPESMAASNSPAATPASRQREPRENSDFLRMVVGELGMRRAGKFRDDIPVSVRMWLPPRKSTGRIEGVVVGKASERAIPQRWVGVTVSA